MREPFKGFFKSLAETMCCKKKALRASQTIFTKINSFTNKYFKMSIYLEIRVTEREREKESWHALLHFSDSSNGQGWSKQKPRARNFFQLSCVDGRAQNHGLSSAVSFRPLAGSSLGTNQCPYVVVVLCVLASLVCHNTDP